MELEKNRGLKGKTIGQIAREQGKGIVDAFLDLAVEEKLGTAFIYLEENVDENAMAQILSYPKAVIGLSDGGAHVQYQSGAGFSTYFLSHWI